jgi:hypothetical protein
VVAFQAARRKPAAALAWTLILIVLAFQARQAVRTCWRDSDDSQHTSDFTAFYAAGKLALNGENIYDYRKSGITKRPFIYPPLFAVVPMMPLALLPHNAALVVFTLLNCALLLGTCALLYGALWGGMPRPPPWSGKWRDWRGLSRQPKVGVFLAAAACYLFVDGNNRMGNANLFVVFPLALAFWLLMRVTTPTGKLSAGMSIALATAIKVTPGVFGLYLLWTRRGIAMVGGALGLLAFLLLVPSLGLGFGNTLDRLREFGGHAQASVSGNGSDDDIVDLAGAEQKQLEGGYGIRGLLMHYLTAKPLDWKMTRHGVRYAGKYTVNVVDLPPDRARLIAYGVCGLCLLLTVALTWSAAARGTRDGLALSFSLVTVTMLLLAPITRRAHLCVLLISFAALIALMQQGKIVGRLKTACIACIVALFLTGIVLSSELIGLPASMWTEVAGANSFLLLGLYAANAWALTELTGLRDAR